MKLSTPKGAKVIYTGCGGNDHHKETANKYLTVGNEYTVDRLDIASYSSDVFLKEITDTWPTGVRVYFNTVMFRNVGDEESSAEFVEKNRPTFDEYFKWEKGNK